MSEQDKLEALATYFDLMAMNGGMQVYHAAHQLGVLDAIGGKTCNVEEIAAACGPREEPLLPLLAGQYRNLGNEYWDYLPQFLISNVPLAVMDAPDQSEAQNQTRVTALAWMLQPAAEQAARLLEAGTARRDLNIIDIGAGAAVWSLTITAHNATARVVGFLTNPYILAGMSGYLLVMVLFTYAFRTGGTVRVLYPLYAPTFIRAALIARVAYHQPVQPVHVIGMMLLITGTICMSW
jgi:multidrug transporter EmrE-like cation transporter